LAKRFATKINPGEEDQAEEEKKKPERLRGSATAIKKVEITPISRTDHRSFLLIPTEMAKSP